MSRLICVSGLILFALTLVLPTASAAQDTTEARAPDVVYVGSPHDVVAKMLEVAQVKKDDLLYDPGCGDGRICVMAAKKYGCRAVGFDLNPVRIRESLENIKRNGVEKLVRVERKDIFTVDFSEATVVSIYLLPWMNKKLVPQLQKMKPGTRIVAHDYSIEGYPPDKTITMTSKQDAVEHYIYLWTVPLKPAPDAAASADDPDSDDEP
ncbi:MAG: methyltransferase domain-containing protein [Candidatus Anammoximicrobium sp.]|nr:methyltransferase domain-containing protein [Candidatus Anammoximicrobium sp.]